jgi:hypothetical protein
MQQQFSWQKAQFISDKCGVLKLNLAAFQPWIAGCTIWSQEKSCW